MDNEIKESVSDEAARKEENVLDLFYRYYTEEHPMVSDAIYEKFAQIRSQYTEKGEAGFDSIFYAVCELCLEYEHLAFVGGFRTGAQWTMETFSM